MRVVKAWAAGKPTAIYVSLMTFDDAGSNVMCWLAPRVSTFMSARSSDPLRLSFVLRVIRSKSGQL